MDPDSLRVTRLGLFANIGIGFVKVIGGWKFRSQALTADGYHSMGDSFVDLIALMSIFLSSYFKFSTSPSSKGHSISRTLSNSKKIESIGSIIIGFMILTGGVSFAWESSKDLYENDLFRSRVQANNAGEDSLASPIPSFYAAWLAVGSILVKEFIYAITMKVARRNHSLILAANASHHRMDSLTTMLAVFATVAAHIFPKMLIVDPVCGLLVAVFVIKCGADAILGGVAEIRNPSDPITDGKED